MLAWVFKSVISERGRLWTSVGGVAAAMVLILLLEGVFVGSSEQIVAYLAATDADVWVMQEGVSNMHMATSTVPAASAEAIAGVAGVADVTPILYANNFVHAGGRDWFSYIVGLPAGARRGGPWEMAAGTASVRAGEVVIPEILARKSDVVIGDLVQVLGADLRVVGLTRGTYSMANSVTFVAWSDLAGMLGNTTQPSYLLVKALPGIGAPVLAENIRAALPNISVMTREAFVESDRAMAMQMGVDVIRMMTMVGLFVGVLVIAFTIFSSTVKRAREFGIAKALGARTPHLLVAVTLQAMLVSALGFVSSVLLALVLEPAIEYLVPEVLVAYEPGTIALLGIGAILISIPASVLPAARVARIDPAIAFRR